MQKQMSNKEFICCIDKLILKEIPQNEKAILTKAKTTLENNSYLPRVVSDLRASLTPLAISGQLSKETGELYLTITNYPYTNNNLGGGLISVFGNNLK